MAQLAEPGQQQGPSFWRKTAVYKKKKKKKKKYDGAGVEPTELPMDVGRCCSTTCTSIYFARLFFFFLLITFEQS